MFEFVCWQNSHVHSGEKARSSRIEKVDILNQGRERRLPEKVVEENPEYQARLIKGLLRARFAASEGLNLM